MPSRTRRARSRSSVSVIRDVTESKLVERRVSFLTRTSELLNATLDVEHTLGALADVAVPEFAGHVTVDLYDEGVLRCVGARHVDPAKTELMIQLRREYPPTVPEHPVQRAIATGEPQFVPDVQAEAESMAHDERHAQAIHELGNTSGIVVPLAARGRTFGAITFGTVPPQPPFTTRRPRARGGDRPPRVGGARQRAPLRARRRRGRARPRRSSSSTTASCSSTATRSFGS